MLRCADVAERAVGCGGLVVGALVWVAMLWRAGGAMAQSPAFAEVADSPFATGVVSPYPGPFSVAFSPSGRLRRVTAHDARHFEAGEARYALAERRQVVMRVQWRQSSSSLEGSTERETHCWP